MRNQEVVPPCGQASQLARFPPNCRAREKRLPGFSLQLIRSNGRHGNRPTGRLSGRHVLVVERVGLTWKPLFDEPAQATVIPAKVSAAFQALVDRRGDSEFATLGTTILDMIGRAGQHFGHRATLMRTDFGPEIVLLHAALMPALAFHQRFCALAAAGSAPPHLPRLQSYSEPSWRSQS
jgi:hypothetical protein